MQKKVLRITSALILLTLLVAPAAAQTPGVDGFSPVGDGTALKITGEVSGGKEQAVYIVLFEEPPVSLYQGGINGLDATSPEALGTVKLDAKSPEAVAYADYLDAQHAAYLDAAELQLGRSLDVSHQYFYALNGMAVKLTAEEAAVLAKLPGVKQVEIDSAQRITTDAGPTWIGAPSIWDGTSTSGIPGTKGEGVIVGVLDTGINMDHPSFADVGGDGYDHTNPYGPGNYVGWCNPSNPNYDPAYVCNDKLIGAWDYADASSGTESDGPGDDNGHGSHTASTAAGNVIITATLVAPTLSYTTTISGVAPHANIIAYDVCSESEGCFNSDLAAGIDQAVFDGVDVLNESISIGGDTFNGTKQQAYLGAFAAGIVASRSAGNEGPDPYTVGPEPVWTLSSGASTHNRAFPNTLNSMSGGDTTPPADIQGVGFTAGYGPADIVYAGDYGDPLCPIGAFAPGTFSGEIVVCDRGTHARVDKAQSVADGGAGGFVLANDAASDKELIGDAYVIPGVHITFDDGVTLKTWLASGSGHTATISGAVKNTDPSNGDVMAAFSSRGPGEVDVVKPDVTNPGVDIMAASLTVNPSDPPEYQFLSGTSMSSPHTAGSAALLRALYPSWSPAQIRSAMMTSAQNQGVLKEDDATPATPFDMGAGRVNLGEAGMVGLVLNVFPWQYIAADPSIGGDPKTINLPSMQDSDCYMSCGWSRMVQNPTSSTMTWEATYVGDGNATISPASFTISPGAYASFDFDLDVVGLTQNEWHFGFLEWSETSGSAPDVKMPVAAWVSGSTDLNALTKVVSSDTAELGETLTYTITLSNSASVTQTFTVTDVVPADVSYVDSSATGGLVYDTVSNTLTATVTLGPAGFFITEASLTGYVSLAGLGYSPFALPSNSDDGGWALSGLDIDYFGQNYTSAIWSVNGTLELGTASGAAASASNTSFPNPSSPNNVIAGWWTDLDLTSSGNWYVATLSDGTNDYDVFEWEGVPRYGDPSSTATFQIWLQRGSDQIWIAYPVGAFTGSTSDGTIGAENSDGTVGAMYYYNGTGTLPDGSVDLLVERLSSPPAVMTFQVTATTPDTMIVNTVEATDEQPVTNEAYTYTVVPTNLMFVYLPLVPQDYTP